MAQNRLRKLWDAFMDRTPAEKHAILSRSLRRCKDAEEKVAEKLRKLRKKGVGVRRIRRVEKRLKKFAKLTKAASKAVEAARPFVPGTEQTNI